MKFNKKKRRRKKEQNSHVNTKFLLSVNNVTYDWLAGVSSPVNPNVNMVAIVC